MAVADWISIYNSMPKSEMSPNSLKNLLYKWIPFLWAIPSSFYQRLFNPARAESARAVSVRRCPHSGVGEDFLARQLFIFAKTTVTNMTKSRYKNHFMLQTMV